jgi:hypothetical protein
MIVMMKLEHNNVLLGIDEIDLIPSTFDSNLASMNI